MLTAEPFWFSFTTKLNIGPRMVLGYFIFYKKSGYGFRLFFRPSISLVQDPSNKAIISIGINMQVCCFIILAMIIKMLIEQ